MSDFVQNATKKIAIISAFTLCAALSALLMFEAVRAGKVAHDFSVFWRTANLPVEAAYALRDYQPFPYAPTMLLWIFPLGFVPRLAGYLLISAASIVALVLACRPYLSRAALALVLVSPPFFRCLRNGQISALLGALMIWACGTPNRIAAGVAFGVIASIKPQLVIMAPLMLAINRDWRAFFAAGATLFLAVLLSIALFGSARWSEWVGSLDHFHGIIAGGNILNIGISPALVAERLGLDPLPFIILGVGVGGVLVFLCRDMGPLEKATAIGAASLLAAPYALAYDLIVVVPFLAAAVMRGRLLAVVALASAFNPAPLLLTAWELRPRRLSSENVEQSIRPFRC